MPVHARPDLAHHLPHGQALTGRGSDYPTHLPLQIGFLID
jgi:hypothetical protein